MISVTKHSPPVLKLASWASAIFKYNSNLLGFERALNILATFFVALSPLQQKLLAILMILLITVANIISTKFGGWIQSVATIGKLLPIIALVVFGLIKGTAHQFTPLVTAASTASGLGAAILGTLWAYDGWISVGNIAGELKRPARNLPMAIILGLSLVMVTYITMNLAIINVLPVDAVISSEKPASDMAVALFGESGAILISIGILVSIFGALNGYLLTGARVPLAMARDSVIPFRRFFGSVTEKSHTPANVLLFQLVLASFYVFTGSFNMLTDLAVFVLWIFFTMAVAGVFILRAKHPHLARPYKVPLYPVIPIIGIVGGLFILINTLFTSTSNALYGLGVTLIGLPVYMYLKKRGQ